MSKDKVLQSNDSHITIELTRKKMDAARIGVSITASGDLHLSLPRMSEEQEDRLCKVWEELRDALIDIDMHPAVIEETIVSAMDTFRKATYARTIANLF